MKLIAHRGLWKVRKKRNTLSAFESAFEKGIGIETDLRSFSGKLFLAHDVIESEGTHPSFESLIELATKYPQLPLFLNIKEDGLLNLLKPYLPVLEKTGAIFFDMSVPELVQYSKKLSPVHLCTRISEFELQPSAIELCDWVWIDGFYKEFNFERLRKLIHKYQKNWAFVSPELHGRDQSIFWKRLRSTKWLLKENIFLCTDLVESFNGAIND